jgi:multiple sugar transport system substrate-binding protein
MRYPKISAGVAVAVAAMVALAGCAGPSSSGAAATTTGTLEFRNNKPWDFKSFSKVSGKDIGVTLESTQYSGDAYRAFIKQSFRTKESPGLFTWEVGGGLSDLAKQGVIADTSSIWKKAIKNNWVSKDVEDLYTVDRKQYCTPLSVDDWVMFYDKKTFAKYGVQVPKTWDQLMQVADTLKKDGQTPFFNQTKTWSFVWFQTLLAGTDVKLFKDLAAGKLKYTDKRIVDVMNQWGGLIKKGYFNDPTQTDFANNVMADGQVAMAPEGTFWTADAAQAGLKVGEDVDMFTIPMVKTQSTTPVAIETAPACTAETSSQKTLGLKYAEWWMSPQGQSAWVKQQGNVPYTPSAKATTPEVQNLSDKLNSGHYSYYLRYYEATPTDIRTVALEQFSSFMTKGGDPKPYLEAIQAAADKYWAGNEG